jgi:hypothetical protein
VLEPLAPPLATNRGQPLQFTAGGAGGQQGNVKTNERTLDTLRGRSTVKVPFPKQGGADFPFHFMLLTPLWKCIFQA